MAGPVIGLVGVGNWGRNILRDLRTLGARVHAVEAHPPSVERAVQGGADTVVPRIEDLPDCAGFVVANRTVDHLAAVEALLPLGRPMFVEKPLTADIDAARRLDPRAEDLVFVMHKWRYHPGILELAKIASSGEFGPVRGLRTLRMNGEMHHTDVNPVWVLLPHDMSIALEILGEVPTPVSAIPDPLTARGGGLIARMRTPVSAVDVVMEVSVGHSQSLRRIVLACRDAICELHNDRYDIVRILRRDAPPKAPIVERIVSDALPLLEELRTFVAFLEGGPAPRTALRDEIRMLQAIETLQGFV